MLNLIWKEHEILITTLHTLQLLWSPAPLRLILFLYPQVVTFFILKVINKIQLSTWIITYGQQQLLRLAEGMHICSCLLVVFLFSIATIAFKIWCLSCEGKTDINWWWCTDASIFRCAYHQTAVHKTEIAPWTIPSFYQNWYPSFLRFFTVDRKANLYEYACM